MDIIFKGRRTNIPERFREHAVGKLVKIGKLDQKAIRIDVEVTKEPNPRQSGRRERVELTIRSRGPVIRAEAAADDRYTALDLAFAKLEARLRRACDRRKARHCERDLVRAGSAAGAAPAAPDASLPGVADTPEAAVPGLPGGPALAGNGNGHGAAPAGGARRRGNGAMTARWTANLAGPTSPTGRSPRPRASCRSRWRGTARWLSGRSCTRPSR